MHCPASQPTSKPCRPQISRHRYDPVSDDKFPIVPAKRSIIQPEDNGHDDRAFNRLLAAPRRHEAPAADGAAGGFVEAFEIAASFEVDRNRLSFGTDLDPEQHFSFFTEAA